MNQKPFLVALGALTAALAGCGSEINSSAGAGASAGTAGSPPGVGGSGATASGGSAGSGTGATGSGATGATGSGATGSGGSAGGGAGDGGTGAVTCVPGIPASSQIPRMLNRQYDAVVRDLLGISTLDAGDGLPPSAHLYADYNGPMNTDSWRLYQEVASMVADQVMSGPTRSMFISCEPSAPGCLTDTIRSFGRKAFRRALTTEEEASFARFTMLTPTGTPEEQARAILYTFLVSPSFLMIPELSTELEGTAFKLSPHEVAARLSFLLWGSIPDDTLTAAADAGELATKEQILAQAQRMSTDRTKTAGLIAAYHRIYMDMENADSHWWKSQHDTTLYPNYNPAAEPAYMKEMDLFFEDVTFSGGSFKDFFLSNVGYVNNQTAALYGLNPADYGPELTRVQLDPATRPGFLTRVGFLQSYSHFEATSPILRGAYITVNIIGVNPGAPDPNVFLTEPPPGDYPTQRAYTEALTSQPSCTGCHTPFVNPPGFVLENYDAVGAWQTMDRRGGPIDATADVYLTESTPTTITSPLQLMTEIGNSAGAKRRYAERWVTFATGRQANPNDACTVDLLDSKLAVEGYTILNLLSDLTQADSFRLRVRGN